MKTLMKNVLMIGGLLFALPAGAQEPASGDTAPVLGQDARAWLELQKNPAAQAPELRPVPGEVSEQVYQRYLNSFKSAIPESFDRDSFVGKGGGG